MKTKMKKGVSILLVAIMLTTVLAACGDDKPQNSGDPNSSNSNNPTASEFVYVPEYVALPKEITDMYNMACYEDYIYFASYVETVGEPYLVYIGEDGMGIMDPEVRSSGVTGSVVVGIAGADGADGVVDSDIPMTLPMPEDGVIPEGYMETNDYTYEYTISKVKTDGTGLESLPEYKSPIDGDENGNGNANINRIACDDEGNIWVLENVYSYDHETDVSNEQYFVRKLSQDGAELLRIDASSMKTGNEEYFYINNMQVDGSGNVYMSSENTLTVFDSSGAKLFALETDNWLDSFVRLKDGTVAVATYGSGNEIWVIDAEAKTWGDKYPMKTYSNAMITGGDEYDFYYSDGSSLYGYKLADAKEDKLVNWLSSNIDGYNISGIIIQDDGTIMCALNNYGEDEDGNYISSYELAKLVKTPSSEVASKTTLTMAVMYLDYDLRAKVLDFNKTSTTHRIEVMDYSEYNDYSSENQEDWNAGLTKLQTEIISGNIPDMMSLSNLPVQQYVNKGILEDLYPYIDNDPNLSRDMFIESVIGALETDGKLYQIGTSFYVTTAIGNRGIVGDKQGWTPKEAMDILAQAPEGATVFGPYFTKSEMLRYSCMFDLDSYIDWTTGKCNFDSEEFISLLEFVNHFPAEYEWSEDSPSEPSLAQEGRMLASLLSLSDFTDFQMYSAMFGNDVTFKGLPTANSDGHALSVSNSVAITSQCKDKDAAWQFISSLFVDEGETSRFRGSWGFPMTKDAFQAKIEEAMKKDTYIDPETGEEVEQSKGGWGWDDFNVEIYAATQEQIDMITGLINSIDKVFTYDDSALNIIIEESEAFFEGQKSAQEIASIIQSRMSMFVSEQM